MVGDGGGCVDRDNDEVCSGQRQLCTETVIGDGDENGDSGG